MIKHIKETKEVIHKHVYCDVCETEITSEDRYYESLICEICGR